MSNNATTSRNEDQPSFDAQQTILSEIKQVVANSDEYSAAKTLADTYRTLVETDSKREQDIRALAKASADIEKCRADIRKTDLETEVLVTRVTQAHVESDKLKAETKKIDAEKLKIETDISREPEAEHFKLTETTLVAGIGAATTVLTWLMAIKHEQTGVWATKMLSFIPKMTFRV